MKYHVGVTFPTVWPYLDLNKNAVHEHGPATRIAAHRAKMKADYEPHHISQRCMKGVVPPRATVLVPMRLLGIK
jgi:hypothetical protein